MDIGTRLRSARKAKSLSQERLARQADVSLNVVSRLERGEIEDPHISTLIGLSQALGIPVEELLGKPVTVRGSVSMKGRATVVARGKLIEDIVRDIVDRARAGEDPDTLLREGTERIGELVAA
jgi:transcriptional regulator with XRE-family HTH domain